MVLKQAPRYERPGQNPRSSQFSFPEKAAAAACYLPGMVGFIVGLVYILAKGPGCDRQFFRFHFYQAIFLSVCMFCLLMLSDGMSGAVIGTLRLFEGLIGTNAVVFLTENMALTNKILMAPFVLLIPYGMIWALLGKFAEIPWVSKIIRGNISPY